jgi:hypothetical protein
MTGPSRGLTIGAVLFGTLMEELARRGAGSRESGAFLLGHASTGRAVGTEDAWPVVTAVAFYDDLDPACLTGGITFSADGYTALGILCRRSGVRVVGDIHTHPGRWVGQSGIDATHPMVALPGHIALIAPWYARGPADASHLGAHVFVGAGQWTSHLDNDVASVLRVAKAPVPDGIAAALRQRAGDLIGRIRRLPARWRSR